EKAANNAGRPMPRVIAGLPVSVCDDRDTAVAEAERRWSGYRNIPTYARALDRGATGSPVDVAVMGDEAEVTARLRGYESAGAPARRGGRSGCRSRTRRGGRCGGGGRTGRGPRTSARRGRRSP